MVRKGLQSLLMAALCCVGMDFHAQEPAEDSFVVRERVDLVIVPVTVKDRKGNSVDNLTRDDFSIFEDGEQREIRYFAVEPTPLSAVILLDFKLSQRHARMIENTLGSLSHAFVPEDEQALYFFDDTVRLGHPFTHEPDRIWKAAQEKFPSGTTPSVAGPPLAGVSRIGGERIDPTQAMSFPEKPSGKRIHDALFTAAQQLRARSRERRRVVLILSDGMNASDNQLSYEDAVKGLVRANVSVYAVHFNFRWSWKRFDVLSRYARETGGDVFNPKKLSYLDQLYSRIIDQARNPYILGFSPGASDGELHTLRVRVNRPKVKLLARNSYLSPGGNR